MCYWTKSTVEVKSEITSLSAETALTCQEERDNAGILGKVQPYTRTWGNKLEGDQYKQQENNTSTKLQQNESYMCMNTLHTT